ncbi:MAG TPA: DUF4332 domain-containing protein [Actinobacteria bacterium]|nr:DUF4332 domain-containing protein [Actinomycetota bacterium]
MTSIGSIGGLDHKRATKLRKARIRTTEALLRRGGDAKGRRALAKLTGLSTDELLRLAHRADLMRIKGIGSEYVTLLGAAGVETIRDLRRRNPARLVAAMTAVNEERRLVRRLPTLRMVTAWVEAAKSLDPLVR